MKNNSLTKSFRNALGGLVYVLHTQRNMRIHLVVAGLVLLASLFLGINRWEFIILLFAVTFVLVAELVNTAVESAIDIVTTTYDPLAKIAKDVAAGAVLVASINAVVVGVFIFYDKFGFLLLGGLEKLRNLEVYITVAAILLVWVFMLWIRTLRSKNGISRKRFISGQSALAFSLLTAMIFITRSAFVALSGLIMAFLVCQNKVATKTQTGAEVVAGAVLGFLTTLLLFQLVFYFRG